MYFCNDFQYSQTILSLPNQITFEKGVLVLLIQNSEFNSNCSQYFFVRFYSYFLKQLSRISIRPVRSEIQ